MSLRAYQQAAHRSETPRDTEYRLFAQVTRALMDVKSKPREDLAEDLEIASVHGPTLTAAAHGRKTCAGARDPQQRAANCAITSATSP